MALNLLQGVAKREHLLEKKPRRKGDFRGALCKYSVMAPNEPGKDDEMDLINAEFESMVSGLNLDQSSPRTYLDELDEIEREEVAELYRKNQRSGISKVSRTGIIQAITQWWNRKDNNEGDGAKL
jgi:hypothetical protein